MGKIASNRVGNEFGQPDDIQYRWILPKFVGAEWTVARHFHSRQTFLVPGSAAELKLSIFELSSPGVDGFRIRGQGTGMRS
ncbi:hypothetical protein ACC732_36485, partial [Rhizobium ruizarguesonis]